MPSPHQRSLASHHGTDQNEQPDSILWTNARDEPTQGAMVIFSAEQGGEGGWRWMKGRSDWWLWYGSIDGCFLEPESSNSFTINMGWHSYFMSTYDSNNKEKHGTISRNLLVVTWGCLDRIMLDNVGFQIQIFAWSVHPSRLQQMQVCWCRILIESRWWSPICWVCLRQASPPTVWLGHWMLVPS